MPVCCSLFASFFNITVIQSPSRSYRSPVVLITFLSTPRFAKSPLADMNTFKESGSRLTILVFAGALYFPVTRTPLPPSLPSSMRLSFKALLDVIPSSDWTWLLQVKQISLARFKNGARYVLRCSLVAIQIRSLMDSRLSLSRSVVC